MAVTKTGTMSTLVLSDLLDGMTVVSVFGNGQTIPKANRRAREKRSGS
jgi:hypothetical protein